MSGSTEGHAMRLAAFNVENLFNRTRALNGDMANGENPILERFGELNALIDKAAYSAADKTRMIELLRQLDLEASDTGDFVILRRNRGQLLRRPRAGGIEIVADGRADWIGWIELRVEAVNERAMRHTADVIRDVGADVVAVIEAENREALILFDDTLLNAAGGRTYRNIMLIDGNDMRGIDVGLMAREVFVIGDMRSHVNERQANGEALFSRDCPEYEITTPAGGRFWLLINHFKSKVGTQRIANAKRKAQADRVAELYAALRAAGEENVAIVGDFNDTPDSAPLATLLSTDLKDVSALPAFDDGGYPGTYGGSTARNKIDYILLSPALFASATGGGIFRKGMWPGVRPKKWDVYPTLTKEVEAASDHGAIYVDLQI
jgi:endonuclease/exonuclease/phosphatase family metal-dependent hydrolase